MELFMPYRYALLSLLLATLSTWAFAAQPIALELVLVQWPDEKVLSQPRPNAVVDQALQSAARSDHLVLEATESQPLEKLINFRASLQEERYQNFILSGRYLLNDDNEKTTLWLDQESLGQHVYGTLTIDKQRYYNIVLDVVLEDGDHYWPVHLQKKTKTKQINYVEKMPLGLVFYIS